MPLTQETRQEIFERLKKHLLACTPPMVISNDSPGHDFAIIGNKEVPYGYDKKRIPGMYFSSLAMRKDSVAFYFFPSYMDKKLAEVAPETYKLLKGKTCFHFKKAEQVNDKEMKALLKSGMTAWKEAGFLK